MSNQDRRVPRSYDEIVRGTVPDLDSSRRPTVQQEADARDGFRALDDEETELRNSVVAAVGENIDVEVARSTVTLRGSVRDIRMIDEIEARVARIDGVDHVSNQLVVGA